MVSIRLSEDEYLALRELCTSTGARSVSDLTRDAMHALLNGNTRADVLHIRMDEICDQMNSLGRRIEEFVERFAVAEKQS